MVSEMMTAEQLKASILQMAMQGKLVPQDLNDQSAETLLAKVRESAEFLSDKKKTSIVLRNGSYYELVGKKSICIDEDLPFEIPSSWRWERLGNIGETNIGLTYKPSDVKDEGTVVLRSGNIQKGKMNYDDIIKVNTSIPQRAMICKGDILICARNGSRRLVGKSAIVDRDGMAFGAFMAKFHSRFLLDKYIQYYIESPLFRGTLDGVGTETINQITQSMLKNSFCPVPPLAEQHRIVAKIEELMPYVDQYAKASTRLTVLNTAFPDQMKKSILQEAVQGKLVPQDPNDEPASELLKKITAEKEKLIKEGKIKKEKKLAPIAEDEIPFDIPGSWKWVYIGDVFQHNTGKALNGSNREGTIFKYITTSNLYWNRFDLDKLKEMPFTDNELDKCTVKKGDLLVCEGGDYGRSAIWNYDYDMRIQNHIHRLRPYSEVDIQYFYYVFYFYKNAGLIHGKGIGIKGLSSNVLHNLIVPLPPLAEQKRIVAKIEELMPYCDELKDKQEKA